MNNFLKIIRKYDFIIYILIAILFFCTLFIPYFSFDKAEHWRIKNCVIDNFKYYPFGSATNIVNNILYILILSGILSGIFQHKHKLFMILKNISFILFPIFFIQKERFCVFNTDLINMTLGESLSFQRGISWWIWIFLLALEGIYIFIALQKAFPFNKTSESNKDNS